jgi:hypothetical protein
VAVATEDVDLEPLELEQFLQGCEARIHARYSPATPRRFCIAGLVVVYCRNCFFAG